jgi:hypothetical protein
MAAFLLIRDPKRDKKRYSPVGVINRFVLEREDTWIGFIIDVVERKILWKFSEISTCLCLLH